MHKTFKDLITNVNFNISSEAHKALWALYAGFN